VASATEAKAALKELRHKKREIKFLRSALLVATGLARPQPCGRSLARSRNGVGQRTQKAQPGANRT
jgi:hypothetical protein